MFRRFISKIAQAAQFKFNLGGRLFLEHLIASIFLSIASVAAIIYVPGPVLGLITVLSLPLEKIVGSASAGVISGIIIYTFLGLLCLGIPLFLLLRLALVYKKDGARAFLGALIGELIIVIPFLRMLYTMIQIVSSLLS